jgi:hypothetical protein
MEERYHGARVIFQQAMEFAFNRPPTSRPADDSYPNASGGVFS